MKFDKTTIIPEHSHESQWEIVLDGSVDLWLDEVKRHYRQGDKFFIGSNVSHRAVVNAGYKAIACFNQSDRYREMRE